MIKKDFEHLNQKQFDKWSRFWDSKILRLIYFNKIYDKVTTVIKENLYHRSKFLDVGCGTAEVISRLAKEFEEIEFVGIDFSKGMVDKAINKTSHLKNVKIIEANVENLPFKDENFDFILCLDSFHHFYNPDLVLKGINRVLKNNGLFLLVDPSPDISYIRIILKIFKYLESAKKYYSKKEIKNILSDHNFSIIFSFVFYFNNFFLSVKTN